MIYLFIKYFYIITICIYSFNFPSGTTGQSVKNYFPITSYTNWCLYQYRVDFSPEEDRIRTKRGLLSQHRERLGGYLFDGTMLFSGNRFDPPVSYCCYK
jgi:aubergine